MANLPGSATMLPGCDPPYPVRIERDGIVVLETDNCGIAFKLVGDKHAAAVGLLERALKDIAKVSNLSFNHREGAFDFIVVNKNIIDCHWHFTEQIFGLSCPSLVENRAEVFEIVDIIKSLLKLKVFL